MARQVLIALAAATLGLGLPAAALSPAPGAISSSERLSRIIPPGMSLSGRGAEQTLRANRVAALLNANRHTPETQAAARQFLERFVENRQPLEYHAAAGMAVLVLGEASRSRALTPDELQVLRQLSGRFTTVQALARLLCSDAELRGQPEAARLESFDRLLAREGVCSQHAFLVLNGGSAPQALQRYWEGGPRFQATGRPAYEGIALQHYYCFRGMKFPSTGDEIAFLWSQIEAYYRRLAAEPRGPRRGQALREEARAATARLIEIGEPVVRFLLSDPRRLRGLADPEDIRSASGEQFELWIVKALPRKEFAPVLRELAACDLPSVRRAALDALERIDAGNPSPYGAHYVFSFGRPSGLCGRLGPQWSPGGGRGLASARALSLTCSSTT
ncbi:MAG: hypothetical protein ACK47B_03665 [Armatimonadota bacterium]